MPLDTAAYAQPCEEIALFVGEQLEDLVDSIVTSFARRLRIDPAAPGDVIGVTYIAENGASERFIDVRDGAISKERTGSRSTFLTLTWEDVTDALRVERGEYDFVTALLTFRATLQGEPEAINWFATHVTRPGEAEPAVFVPFISQSICYSPQELSTRIHAVGLDELFLTALTTVANFWTQVNLYAEAGPHVVRFAIDGLSTYFLVCTEDGCRIVDSCDEGPNLDVVWPDDLTFARYVGDEEEMTSLYLSGRLSIEGDLTLLAAWSRAAPQA